MSYVKQFGSDLAHLVHRQDGLVSVEQLAAQGFDRATVYRRIKTGQWKRLLPTVIMTTSGHPTRRQLLVAGLLWGGAASAIDGADACAWYGLKPPGFNPGQIHIVVPWDAGVRSRGFVVVRRSTAEIAMGTAGRLRYVDPATAVLVAARAASSTASAIDVLSRALQIQLVTVAGLLAARESIGDKWCGRVDAALVAVDVGLRSPAEKVNRDLILTSTVLPEPRWNQWLDLADGGALICAAALWEDAGMVEEVLGRKWHAWGEQFEKTEARRARLVAVDLVVQGATPTQLSRSGATVLARLERTYLLNAGRGMPAGVQLVDPPIARW
jgi:hypothetical protein